MVDSLQGNIFQEMWFKYEEGIIIHKINEIYMFVLSDIGACEVVLKKKASEDFERLLQTEHSKLLLILFIFIIKWL